MNRIISCFVLPLDDAPNCIADESYCSQAGLDYVCEEDFDTGNPNDTCQTGVRARCSFPDIPTPLLETPATMLKVISYNVWELRYAYNQNGQRERTCRILPELIQIHPDVDVIVFNEVFMGGCFATGSEQLTFRDILTEYGFTEFTRTVGIIPVPTQPENGGVFIASKWPILRERSRVFAAFERTTADSLSQKGVVYARIEKSVNSVNMRYHVFGTHLQSSERQNSSLVRILQAREMYEFQRSQNIPSSEAVIYAGDLNADFIADPTYADEVIAELKSTIPPIVGRLSTTYDRDNNDVFSDRSSGASWYDYAVYSNEHLQPTRTALRAIRPRASPFTVCFSAVSINPTYPDTRFCVTERTITDLSDHYAVMGTFDFGDGDWSTRLPTTSTIPTTSTTTPTEQREQTSKGLDEPKSTEGSGNKDSPCILLLLVTIIVLSLLNV
ncbi:hypothetical protein HOLleu_07912 [Holothuria leucospilota]|uniref:sphingomyelin phosphodiesterase n=1 Tax=Holothuria leucospilota TaxID=206669 RepID=A0A9Q1HD35_HOLLE|nr:hypothetical protein HOLleu_07912 [Holothuria leucospilota]